MKTQFKNKATAVAIGVLLGASAAVFDGQIVSEEGFSLLMPSAVAAQGEGGRKGQMGGSGYGGGGQGLSGRAGSFGQRGGRSVESLVSDVSDDGDDSDRPDWAMGNKEENPHRGDPNPTPGVSKGDLYGDLYVVVRNPVTGEPILVDGELQICLDTACEQTVLTVDGEVPEGVTPIEVEFGRLNIGRAPTKVIEHAEDEAMTKILNATTLTLDPAGRIIVDGAAIDSPLENLAIYIAIMSGDEEVLEALSSLKVDPMALAAAALGAAADKTGEISIDMLAYSNAIYELIPEGDSYVDYGDFDYDRSIYDQTVKYVYTLDDGLTYNNATVNLKDYLTATQPELEGASGITLFSIAADDALEVVELIHTQIHTSVLPGTV